MLKDKKFDVGTISFRFLFDHKDSVFALRIFYHGYEQNLKITLGTRGFVFKQYFMGEKKVISKIPKNITLNVWH